MSTALVIIDPQGCFMDEVGAPLPVPGALADMQRLATFIQKSEPRIDAVYVTLDTHPFDHISHANRWVNATGEHPAPYTIITYESMLDGDWQAADSRDQAWQLEYLRRLKRPHYIWPVHGQKYRTEWQIEEQVKSALTKLANRTRYLEKGMHRDTEQFGAFGAEVPYPGAVGTEINRRLIRDINQYSTVIFAGQASSHCVMDSVNQFLDHIPAHDAAKVVLLIDCMSPVAKVPGGPDFPAQAMQWFETLRQRGLRVTTSTEYALETQ